MNKYQIVCLSSYSEPTLGLWLREIQRAGLDFCVVLDEKEPSEKDLNLWIERTSGRLPHVPLCKFQPTPFFFVYDHNDMNSLTLLRRFEPDLILNCGTPRILKRDVIDIPRIGVLNVHPGRLPDYRGCSSVEWALFNGDPICNTAHLMTEAIDDGPIVSIEPVEFSNQDNYIDLRVKTYEAGFRLMATAALSLLADPKTSIQENGKYWPPIPENEMKTVLSKFRSSHPRCGK